MDRRSFLHLAAAAPWLQLPLSSPARRPKEWNADVAVIGGGVGGVAAALAAARHGASVILTEETDWIGGQLTAQAVPPDEHPWIESFGCTRTYRRFRDGVRDFYRRNYPLTPAARANPHLSPGNGNVSRLCHEPRVALAVLWEMLAPHVSSGRVRVLQPCRPISASVSGDRARNVLVATEDGASIPITARYFLDATELGDLLPLTKAEFVTGAESQKETGEPHAASTAQPANQQAFTYCFAIDYLGGEDHTIERPKEYDFWRKYLPELRPAWPGPLLSWRMTDPISLKVRAAGFNPTGPVAHGLNLWTYRRIADRRNFAEGTYRADVSLVNWPQNDYWLGTLIGPAAAQHRERAKQLSLSLLYWMQTEGQRPDGKQGWKGLRLRPDIVGTLDGLAKFPYVRESRRIKAEFTVLEQHVGTEARRHLTGKREGLTAERFADSVGIGSYRIDLHPSSAGVNYIDISSLPFQIPLGALVPVRLENLLPACKNLGVTHVTNGCYRLHPVEWNVGEAAGALAAFCVLRGVEPREVHKTAKLLQEYQALLRRDGVELSWPTLTPR